MKARSFIPYAFIIGAGILVAIMICLSVGADRAYEERLQHLYSSWCKLEHRTDISYEEWHRLYYANLLPHR